MYHRDGMSALGINRWVREDEDERRIVTSTISITSESDDTLRENRIDPD